MKDCSNFLVFGNPKEKDDKKKQQQKPQQKYLGESINIPGRNLRNPTGKQLFPVIELFSHIFLFIDLFCHYTYEPSDKCASFVVTV